MSSNISTMSTDLATMASALATMSSSLATMSSSLATTALTSATSTAPLTAQPEGSRLAPTKQTVYILTFIARKWQGALDTSTDGNRSDWPPFHSAHGTLGVHVFREAGKQAGRHWLIKALDNRIKGVDLTDGQRSALEHQWYVPETDENGIWKRGWMKHDVDKPREKSEDLTVTLVGRVLDTTSNGADGNDEKDKGKDKGEGRTYKSMGVKRQGQGADDKATTSWLDI